MRSVPLSVQTTVLLEEESFTDKVSLANSDSLVGMALLETAIIMATNKDERHPQRAETKRKVTPTRHHPWEPESAAIAAIAAVAAAAQRVSDTDTLTVTSDATTIRTVHKHRPDSYFYTARTPITNNKQEVVKSLSFNTLHYGNCITRALRLEQETLEEGFASIMIKRGIENARSQSKKFTCKTSYDFDAPRLKQPPQFHPQDKYSTLPSPLSKKKGNRAKIEAGLRLGIEKLLADTVSVDGHSVWSVSDALPLALAQSLSRQQATDDHKAAEGEERQSRQSTTSDLVLEVQDELDTAKAVLDSFMMSLSSLDQYNPFAHDMAIPLLVSIDSMSDNDDDDDDNGINQILVGSLAQYTFLDMLLQQIEIEQEAQAPYQRQPMLHLSQVFQWTDNPEDPRFSLNRQPKTP